MKVVVCLRSHYVTTLLDWTLPRSKELHQPNEDQTNASSLHIHLSASGWSPRQCCPTFNPFHTQAEAVYSYLHGLVYWTFISLTNLFCNYNKIYCWCHKSIKAKIESKAWLLDWDLSFHCKTVFMIIWIYVNDLLTDKSGAPPPVLKPWTGTVSLHITSPLSTYHPKCYRVSKTVILFPLSAAL